MIWPTYKSNEISLSAKENNIVIFFPENKMGVLEAPKRQKLPIQPLKRLHVTNKN